MFACLGDPGQVGAILRGWLAMAAGLWVQNVDCSRARIEVDPIAPQIEAGLALSVVDNHVRRCCRERVADYGFGQPDSAVVDTLTCSYEQRQRLVVFD